MDINMCLGIETVGNTLGYFGEVYMWLQFFLLDGNQPIDLSYLN